MYSFFLRKVFFLVLLASLSVSAFSRGTKEDSSDQKNDISNTIADIEITSAEEGDAPGEETQSEGVTSEEKTANEDSSVQAEPAEIYYLSSNNKFRILEYDGEVLDITFNKDGGIKTKVYAAGTNVVVKTFDTLMRVIETVVFSQENSINTLTEKTVFLYEEKSQYPCESTAVQYGNNTKTYVLYNKDGFVISKKLYSGKYELTRSQIGEDILLQTEKYTYDSDNRVTEYALLTDTSDLRKLYRYDNGFTQPDTRVFRDSVLREEITYSGEQSYTKTTYFDNNQSVSAVYSDGVKKEELFKNGSKVIRRIHY